MGDLFCEIFGFFVDASSDFGSVASPFLVEWFSN